MSTALLLDIILVGVVAIVALPLIGQFLAMMLGTSVTVRRRDAVCREKSKHIRLDTLEARLRRAARVLGCRLAADDSLDGDTRYLRVEARTIADRRFAERRGRAQSWQARKDSDRRLRERRAGSRRRRFI